VALINSNQRMEVGTLSILETSARIPPPTVKSKDQLLQAPPIYPVVINPTRLHPQLQATTASKL
jgi:hypothetical protein